MIACSHLSQAVDGAIHHGLSYNPSQKKSQSLFTEQVKMKKDGVFPVLYKLLTDSPVPIRNGRHRSITLLHAYSRILGITAEFSQSQGNAASNLRAAKWRAIRERSATFVLEAEFATVHGQPTTLSPCPAFPEWGQPGPRHNIWHSPPQSVPSRAEFDFGAAVARQFLYLPSLDHANDTVVFALSDGRMHFPEEIPIFLCLYHLSSIVRYKPQFLDTIRDSDAWPLVLTARRHLLFRGILLALSNALQRNVVMGH
jgi:hypothetical protein